MDIKGCLACTRCKDEPDEIGCIQKDEAPKVLKKMVEAQLVIFASPLYFWGFTAQIKAIIDRTYCLYTRFHEPDHESLVDGQRKALLVTGAGPYENNAEEVFTAFGRMQKPHKAVKTGDLFVGNCTTADQMAESVKEKALTFARKIIS